MTQAELKEIITYDPDTGFVKWKQTGKGRKIKPPNISDGVLELEGYVSMQIKRKRYKVHRLIWLYMTGDWPKDQIDHINRNPTDNRWCNLREVTCQQNQFNRNSKGYYLDKKTGKYDSMIFVNGKSLYLGRYETAQEAKKAYLEAKYKFHGIMCPLPGEVIYD